jgi:hypothetical protein
MRQLVRSLLCCVLATGAWSQNNVTVVYPPMQPPTVVVIRHGLPRPLSAEAQEEYAPARQITYFIAFKTGVVREADQYWVKGRTLYYVTTDHQRRTAPVDSVDRVLSKQLNSEQKVAFYLPSEQVRAGLRPRLVRHTATLVRKRCCCALTQSAVASSPTRSGASRTVRQRN